MNTADLKAIFKAGMILNTARVFRYGSDSPWHIEIKFDGGGISEVETSRGQTRLFKTLDHCALFLASFGVKKFTVDTPINIGGEEMQ